MLTKTEILNLLECESSSTSSSGSDGDDSYYDLANNFDRIIGWGRMALLIDYNSDNETIRLRNDEILDR